MPSKSDVEVLSQLNDDENGHYRLRVGPRVHYLTIRSGVFDDDTMRRPHLLVPMLPDFPRSPWTTMTISRSQDGVLTTTVSAHPLPEIRSGWHERRVDVLSLERTRRYRSGVHEVKHDGQAAIAKVVCFAWDIPRMERETWAYSVLARHYREHPGQNPVAPDFIAHLTENGRVIGILLQKLDGEPACIDDLSCCEALLHRLHGLGLVHGDVNRYNFLVDRVARGGVRLVDFEHAKTYDEDEARAELLSLPAELAEETGRGATVVVQS